MARSAPGLDLFVEKSQKNGRALTATLRDLGFNLSVEQNADIEAGKDFIRLKNGPYDLDLVFAPDGIARAISCPTFTILMSTAVDVRPDTMILAGVPEGGETAPKASMVPIEPTRSHTA